MDLVQNQHIVELYCTNNLTYLSCGSRKAGDQYVSAKSSLQIDLATVIPVAIKALTFSSSTVVGGNDVTATISLDAPAPIDTPFKIVSTDPKVAEPTKDSVTIKKGESSASFEIQTLPQSAEKGVFIRALYGEGETAKLIVTP